MSHKLRNSLIGVVIVTLFYFGHIQAQTPRPTPTNVSSDQPTEEDKDRGGTIQGAVYEDTNGDGRCGPASLDSGGAVEGVDIEFVSSDAQTIITLRSGTGGLYSLVAAGHSYWGVTAKPGAEWVVTSQKTLYAPIDNDNLVAAGVNFCVQKATTAKVVLPASGAAANSIWLWFILGGFVLLTLGAGMQWRKYNLAAKMVQSQESN